MQRADIDSPTRTRRKAQPTALASPRFPEVDALRGVAILMMVAYHLVWDLDRLGDADLAVTTGPWGALATVTATLFVGLVGVSLAISHDRVRHSSPGGVVPFRRYLLRGLRILGYGLLVTVAVALADVGGQIWFGILHLIGLSIILAWPFLGQPWLALSAAIPVLLAPPFVRGIELDGPWLLPLGVRGDVGRMVDYYPLIPWFGVVLLGIVAGSILYRDGHRRYPWPEGPPTPLTRLLAALGHRSLLIYLLHQPLLIAALWVIGLVDL